ncbi:putative serine/threonine protein kinase [Gemmatimonas aurantiaca T-27]|uniref:non-specific serine/threonine protein kinase n=1 Tax=Gemmatimonas aurantiaca (strain DSM 14586 / JCM 11422 / NBRC 100505 / T-27) TaxID=379066 RepID=C1A3Y3_GEMAT|nr:serine/threonine-protein kinase [Gemmatimonas aurantiaca]BAH38808.1 putative serine/threonine protein kinase [Gemmatimonas aurantiaca T-27]
MPDRYLGRSLGKYRVTRLLGTGAFAWVYEAVDQDLEIPVALKILRPEFAGQESAESRFRREASTAARLRHPNIVTVRDVGQIDGTAFVAMDLYPVTLGRRLALVDRLPEPEVVRLGIGIAAALSVAHASQVIHRDIKPDNILIDSEGEAVVADFGLARALTASNSMSATNQVLGTPHYFSPEQARGQELDGRSDLYALGITLYRTATGQIPFDGDDWYAVARQHIEDTPPSMRSIVPELTPEFEQVVMRLLAKTPEERFPNALQVVDALAALPNAPERSAGARRIGSHTIEAFRPPTTIRRWWWVGAAAVIVLGGVWGVRHPWDGAPVTPDVRPDTTRVPGDTSASTPVRVDSGATPTVAPPTTSAATGAPVIRRPTRPGPALARIELTAPDSAELYVDNKLVGFGHWTGEHPVVQRVEVRAVLPHASVNCETAMFDTVLTGLRAGQQADVELAVRDCAVVRYVVKPRDARVSFTPLDGGRMRELRADSAAAMTLPQGRYLLRISARGCSTFQDTVQVTRVSGDAAISRSLICS